MAKKQRQSAPANETNEPSSDVSEQSEANGAGQESDVVRASDEVSTDETATSEVVRSEQDEIVDASSEVLEGLETPETTILSKEVLEKIQSEVERAVQSEEDAARMDAKPTFAEVRAAYRANRERTFAVRGHDASVCAYLGSGVAVTLEEAEFPLGQLLSLARSYTDALLENPKISFRII